MRGTSSVFHQNQAPRVALGSFFLRTCKVLFILFVVGGRSVSWGAKKHRTEEREQ